MPWGAEPIQWGRGASSSCRVSGVFLPFGGARLRGAFGPEARGELFTKTEG
jgi:hypothetical protein